MLIIRYTALYCRISKNSPTNDESNSIVNQKILLQRAAVQYNFEHTQLFVDDGYSGTVFDRPALKQMEDAIRPSWNGVRCIGQGYFSSWTGLLKNWLLPGTILSSTQCTLYSGHRWY